MNSEQLKRFLINSHFFLLPKIDKDKEKKHAVTNATI